ncbi:hypothetical protein BDZ97DRAFT_1925806 [Flammula alnicola]|nr:hypothetical protein BDZ97DRAFT_1925806 [Flammula alnicola]
MSHVNQEREAGWMTTRGSTLPILSRTKVPEHGDASRKAIRGDDEPTFIDLTTTAASDRITTIATSARDVTTASPRNATPHGCPRYHVARLS